MNDFDVGLHIHGVALGLSFPGSNWILEMLEVPILIKFPAEGAFSR